MQAIAGEDATIFVLRKVLEIPIYLEMKKEAEVILLPICREERYLAEETNGNISKNKNLYLVRAAIRNGKM